MGQAGVYFDVKDLYSMFTLEMEFILSFCLNCPVGQSSVKRKNLSLPFHLDYIASGDQDY